MSECYAVVYEFEKRFYVAFAIGTEPHCNGRIEEFFFGDTALQDAEKLAEELDKPLKDAEKAQRMKEKRSVMKINKYSHRNRISKKHSTGLAKFIGLL